MAGIASFTLKELAAFTQSKLVGEPNYVITGFADLESALSSDVSFLSNPRYTSTRYMNQLLQTAAGAVFVAPHVPLETGKNYLIHEDPSRAFQLTIEAMRGPKKLSGFDSIHPSSTIHSSASIGNNVAIGPNAVIDENVVIGDHCFIGAGVYIGPNSRLGDHCVIHPNVTIREGCSIGYRVILQPGAVIGSCGFGYTTNAKGEHERLKHVGTVVIEDDVEIGANSTIDRARFTSTVIAKGTKIDNLVDIGHNVKIGPYNLICGQSAVAGSSKTGSHVVIAGQCGIDGHLKLDDGVIVTAKSGVTKSLAKGRYGGNPARPLDQFNRANVLIRNLEKYLAEIKVLKQSIDELKK
jgi:UDP-3-O-[3-hydroxymyristoyl] glucosamine N-acyltransferase